MHFFQVDFERMKRYAVTLWNHIFTHIYSCFLDVKKKRKESIELAVTSTQITDVTWAPILTTHAVDNPFPKAAARPSWSNQQTKRSSYKKEKPWRLTGTKHQFAANIGNHQSRKKTVNSIESI